MKPFTPTEDIQLWQTMEDNGCSWPVYATPGKLGDEECYWVELAIPSGTREQWEFVNNWLSQQAFEKRGPTWLIRPANFEQCQRKCKGVTPSYYLKWRSVAKNATVATDVAKNATTEPAEQFCDSFMRFVCADNGWTDFSSKQVMFMAICRSMVKWLLETKKPVPLGFATVYAFPFRTTWKSMLHKQWPKIGGTLRKKKYRMGVLESLGFIESLHNAELIELHENGTFGWSLEVVAEKRFKEISRDIETETLMQSSPSRYLMRWGSIVRKSYANIIDVVAAHYAKAALPMASVDFTVPKNQLQLRPKISRDRVTATVREVVQAPDISSDFAASKIPVSNPVDAP